MQLQGAAQEKVQQDLAHHLEMVQAVVNRLAGNSFAIRGWSVTLTAALLSLAAKDSNTAFAVVAFYPALAFMGLDAYYLRQERRYRALYDAIRRGVVTKAYEMDPAGFDSDVPSWLVVSTSRTVLGTHLPILAAIVAVLFYALRA